MEQENSPIRPVSKLQSAKAVTYSLSRSSPSQSARKLIKRSQSKRSVLTSNLQSTSSSRRDTPEPYRPSSAFEENIPWNYDDICAETCAPEKIIKLAIENVLSRERQSRSSSVDFDLIEGSSSANRLKYLESRKDRISNRRSLDIADLASLKSNVILKKPSLGQSKKCSDESSLSQALGELTAKYFQVIAMQDLKTVRLENKSARNVVLCYLSLLASTDHTAKAVKPIQESQAHLAFVSHCSQPGKAVHTLRKLIGSLESISLDYVKLIKDRFAKVNERLLVPALKPLHKLVEASINSFEPRIAQALNSCITTKACSMEASAIEESCWKPAKDALMHDLSIYSMLKGHSSMHVRIDSAEFTRNDTYTDYLKAKFKGLKAKPGKISFKAQADTLAKGSKAGTSCRGFV